MMTSSPRHVSFDDCITIRHYYFDYVSDMAEKSGTDWQETHDLVCREFTLPVEEGGCGNNWHILESKLNELSEPCWRMIGMLWNQLFPRSKRLEEDSSDEEDPTITINNDHHE